MAKATDMTGWVMKEHGVPESMLTVIERAENDANGRAMWLCECECGNRKVIMGKLLRSGHTCTCGDSKHKKPNNFIDMTGWVMSEHGVSDSQFTVVERAENSAKGHTQWLCKCSCGNETIVEAHNLTAGLSKRCFTCGHKLVGEKSQLDISGWKMSEHGVPDSHITVIERAEDAISPSGKKIIQWKCSCNDCGYEFVAKGDLIKYGGIKRCPKCRGVIFTPRNRHLYYSPRFIDMTGWKMSEYGVPDSRLTVIKQTKDNKFGKTQWSCKCDCGGYTIVDGNSLRSGKTKSCGCLQREKIASLNRIDITGQKFGKLTVLYQTEERRNESTVWHCQCECGNYRDVILTNLTHGLTQSCGCIKSRGEQKVASILTENNINFVREKRFDNVVAQTGKRLRYDFYLVDYNCVIEYDGLQHYKYSNLGWNTKENLIKTQERDKLKNQYCADNDILLIRIPYTHYDDICIEDLMPHTTQFLVNSAVAV